MCVLSSGGGHNDCLCVYNSLQTASIFITKNKDDVFCPPSECLFPFSHPLCLFFSCQSELSPHETGKIRPKSTSCLLSVIMRGWVQSAQALHPAPSATTHKPCSAKSASLNWAVAEKGGCKVKEKYTKTN